jgi:hypothetical protein
MTLHKVGRLRRALKRAIRPETFLHRVAESAQRCLWRYAPRCFDWRPNLESIDLDITTRCNLGCFNCSRSVGVAPADESLSLAQLERFLRETAELSWPWRSITLAGGEPTLHPELGKIVERLAAYKRDHADCEIRLVSNGHGMRVQEVLSSIPRWVTVKSSAKSSNRHVFHSYNLAPIDVPRYRNADFRRGCFVAEYCGVALTRNGYYGCAPGGAVDRVFGFDLGLKSLALLREAAVREQFATLCRCCGHFKYNYREPQVVEQATSASWQDALEKYKRKRPVLTLY